MCDVLKTRMSCLTSRISDLFVNLGEKEKPHLISMVDAV